MAIEDYEEITAFYEEEAEKIAKAQIQTIKDLNLNVAEEKTYDSVWKSAVGMMIKKGIPPRYIEGIMTSIENAQS